MAVLEGAQFDENLPRGHTTRSRCFMACRCRSRGARSWRSRAVGLGQDDAPLHPGLSAHPDAAAALSSTGRRSTSIVPNSFESSATGRSVLCSSSSTCSLADGLRECRVRPESQGWRGREGPPRGRPRPRGGRPGRSQELPTPRPLGRPASAHRGGAGNGGYRARDPRRRADRQPRLRERQPVLGLFRELARSEEPGAADRDSRPSGPHDRRSCRDDPRRPPDPERGLERCHRRCSWDGSSCPRSAS